MYVRSLATNNSLLLLFLRLRAVFTHNPLSVGTKKLRIAEMRPSVPLNAVRPQDRAIPNIKSAVCNDRIRPRLLHLFGVFRLVRRSKAALLVVAIRRGLHQRHFAVLAVQVQQTLRHADRRRRRELVLTWEECCEQTLRVYPILHAGLVDSPEAAVRAVIVHEFERRQS